jgi:hypothetical protein
MDIATPYGEVLWCAVCTRTRQENVAASMLGAEFLSALLVWDAIACAVSAFALALLFSLLIHPEYDAVARVAPGEEVS